MVPETARWIATPLLALWMTAPAAAEKSPKRCTERLLSLVSQVKKAPDKGSLSEVDKGKNRELFASLDGFFDFAGMTETVLRPHVERLNAEQLVIFRDIFPRLIRLVAYPDGGSFLRGTKVTVGEEKVAGKHAEVPVLLGREANDIEMTATFLWRHDRTWRLVDLAFDGASLSKDYQNQIGRVLEEKGPEGLLRKLRKRLAKELRAVR